jgi:hypothetical protein
LDGQADRTFAQAVARRDTVYRPLLPQVSQGNIRLFSHRQLWRFAAFLVQGIVFPLENQQHFLNVSGFTPYSRLKRTALASTVFFLFPMLSLLHF